MTYTLFLHGEFTEKENRFSYGYIGLGSGREYKLESTSRCFLPHPRSTVPRLNVFCKCLLDKVSRIISVGNCMGQNKIKD